VGRSLRVARMTSAAMVVVGLGACGAGDPGSGAHRDAGSTAIPTAKAPKPESAQRFIKRWAAAEIQMENTGRTTAYLRLSRACQACRRLARSVAHDYAAGGYIHWKGLRIDAIDVPPTSGHVVTYTLHAFARPMTVRESSSRPEEHIPARQVTYFVGLEADGRSYVVASRALVHT